jgi:8-oxo-(d)GTP phosphatase
MTSELKPAHVVEAAGGIPYRWIAQDKAKNVDERAEKADKFAEAHVLRNAGKQKRQKHKPPLTEAEIHFRAVITQLEVCLVHRPKYDDWSWPKGKLEEHESSRHAAIREMEEETGVPVALGPSIGEVEYPLNAEGKNAKHTKTNTVYTKHVSYWMAHPLSDEAAQQRRHTVGIIKRAKPSEIDEVKWVTIPNARKMLSHPLDRDILDQFVDRIQEGALMAHELIIVRHGKAVARKRWNGEDADRPIIPRGAAASFALNQELGCFAPQRLASSPWIRCMETLEPYAWHTGLEVTPLPALTEDAFAENPEAAWQCISEIIDELCLGDDKPSVARHSMQAGVKAVTEFNDHLEHPKGESHPDRDKHRTAATSAGRGAATTISRGDSNATTDQPREANPTLDVPKQYSRAIAVCMHRPVIGGVFEHLRDMCASKSLTKQLIAKSPYMPTGNAVALFIVRDTNGPRIIDIQRMAPVVY